MQICFLLIKVGLALSFGFLLFLFFYFGLKRKLKQKKKILILSCLVFIFFIALFLRWQALLSYLGSPLRPDAVLYRKLADSMSHIFDTKIREPGFIWVVKIWFLLVGSSDLNLRLLTFGLSLILVLLTFFVGQKIFNPYIGLISAFLMSINKNVIISAVSGLREEFFPIMILIIIYILFVKKFDNNFKKAIWAGILGGAVCLTRITSVIFVFPLIVFSFFKLKNSFESLKKIVLSSVIVLVMIFPYFYYQYQTYNDPFHQVKSHTRWFANKEFGGQPGFPTVEQVKESSSVGKPISPYKYIFKMRPFKQAIISFISGFYRTLLGSLADGRGPLSGQQWILYPLYLLGLIFFIVIPKYRFLILTLFLINLPTAFFAHPKPTLITSSGYIAIDPRLVLHLAPIYSMAVAFVIFKIFHLIKNEVIKQRRRKII